MSKQLKQSRETADFTEMKENFTRTSSERIRPLLSNKQTWRYGYDESTNIVDSVGDMKWFGLHYSFDFDDEGTVFITDRENNCVVAEKSGNYKQN